MKYCLASIAALMMWSSVATAAPTVSSGSISWPDDGWYQVQVVTAKGIFSLCEGGRSCEVPPGEYNVINLTTGERFDGILVTGSIINVSGNVISWPDDGWYQVQDEANYSEVCRAGRSCIVEPGSYVVINHTTGTRFPGIQVPTPNANDTQIIPQVVIVTGNVISWPDDGWYQVQDESDYSEVCGGGQSCTVAPGSYQVINHTTGVTYRGVTVVDTMPDNTAQLVVVTGNVISWPDDGWYQVQDESDYSEVCGGGLSCTVPPGSYQVINHTTGATYRGVIVTDSAPDTNAQVVIVTGNVISWPDDGWYQVQNESDYSEVCAGGSSCSVPPGSYQVINHTTGATYIGVEVVAQASAASDSAGTQSTSINIIKDALEVLPLETLDNFYQFAANLHNGLQDGTSEISRIGPYVVNDAVVGDLYSCLDGGTIAAFTQSSNPLLGNDYLAENCANTDISFSGKLVTGVRDALPTSSTLYLRTSLSNGTILNKTSGQILSVNQQDDESGIRLQKISGAAQIGDFSAYDADDLSISENDNSSYSIENFNYDNSVVMLENSEYRVSLSIRGINTQDIQYSAVSLVGLYSLDNDQNADIALMDINIEWPMGAATLTTENPSDSGEYVLSDGTVGSISWSDISLLDTLNGIQ